MMDPSELNCMIMRIRFMVNYGVGKESSYSGPGRCKDQVNGQNEQAVFIGCLAQLLQMYK